MAKRKRLSPARIGIWSDSDEDSGALAAGPPPIAHVAAEASVVSALEEVTAELTLARTEGRLIQAIPLDVIDADYLVRDRMLAADDELSALMASIEARGQQTPIELVALEDGRYGLISGWRRLTALRRLYQETSEDRFSLVQALLRTPENASDAYVAMVEENEIRVGLSYFERARIALKAIEQGVFADRRAALQGLFGSASRARRSKIGSFMPVVEALEDVLRFPASIPERLGLRLSKALEVRASLTNELKRALQKGAPQSLEDEQAIITSVLSPSASPAPAVEEIAPGLYLRSTKQSLTLSGSALTPELRQQLAEWLRGAG